jgi:microsomal dipeptidase-like Zn-dependent dipeptidase/gamma-glutamyl-gamma-aminobutyrate hydrolase PuuD
MKKLFILLALFAIGVTIVLWAQNKSHKVTPLENLYTKIDSLVIPISDKRPIIGISLGYNPKKNSVNTTYVESVLQNGGIPYLIPVTDNVETLHQIIAMLDGLVMTGGEDIAPSYYGSKPHIKLEEVNPERDLYELTLLKLAMDRNVPILGICRGLQLINVAMGGTLYQDIPSEYTSTIDHRLKDSDELPKHHLSILPNSLINQIFGTTELVVNSNHHQGIKQVAPGLKVTAWSSDKLPEVIEAYPTRPILAVQFHPEISAAKGDEPMNQLFRFLIKKAETFQTAKEIHGRILSVDTHTDTPMWFRKGYSIGLRKENLVSIQKMEEGMLDAQFLAAFLAQKERDDVSHQKAVEKCLSLLHNIHADIERYKDFCGIAITEKDAWNLKKEGKKAFFIGIENGYGIGKELKNIRKYKELGVNYITLCHSYDNDICHSSTHTEDANKGLTDFGKEVVKEMNRADIIIDLSHASEGTFWDVIKLSKDPVIASHSGSKTCCYHNRNLTDEQLLALAKNGGVVQICILDSYLNKDPKAASIDDIIRHIDHIVQVAGIDHVGIGSDFDGGGGVPGCNGDNDMINITVKLLEKGYSEEDIQKIWGGNFFRVLNLVQQE